MPSIIIIGNIMHEWDITAEQVLKMWCQLGEDRTTYFLLTKLRKEYNKVPSHPTLKRWTNSEKWQKAARDYDDRMARNISRKAATADSNQVINHRNKLDVGADKVLDRLDAFLRDKELSSIKSWEHAKIAQDIALSAIGKAEVLRGGVSDRKAIEAELKAEDRQKKLEDEFEDMTKGIKDKVISFTEKKKTAGV